jgi:hypothetical protein
LSDHSVLLEWYNNTYLPRNSIVHEGAMRITEVKVQKDSLGGIDYVITRPGFDYKHSHKDWILLKDNTKSKLFSVVKENGIVWEILKNANIPLISVKDSFSDSPEENYYFDSKCLSYGLCSVIRHNGDIQLCSDTYGNPEYTIGNIFQNSLAEIWKSNKRQEVIERINNKRCS